MKVERSYFFPELDAFYIRKFMKTVDQSRLKLTELDFNFEEETVARDGTIRRTIYPVTTKNTTLFGPPQKDGSRFYSLEDKGHSYLVEVKKKTVHFKEEPDDDAITYTNFSIGVTRVPSLELYEDKRVWKNKVIEGKIEFNPEGKVTSFYPGLLLFFKNNSTVEVYQAGDDNFFDQLHENTREPHLIVNVVEAS